MATVTGLTAEKMMELADQELINAVVNSSGRLIMTRRNGDTVDAGNVYRPEGFVLRNDGIADATKLPSEYPIGITIAQVGPTGFPTTLGIVETYYLTIVRAFQRVTNKADTSEVWIRTAFDDKWTNWRLVGQVAGEINLTARATVPWGTLLCDGAAVSRTTYKELFNAIGTRFGAGDGSTTFNVPDLRGRVAVGFNSSDTDFNTVGKIGGAKTHTHPLSAAAWALITGTSGMIRHARIAIANWTRNITAGPGTVTAETGTESYATPLGGETNSASTLQPYMALYYVISI